MLDIGRDGARVPRVLLRKGRQMKSVYRVLAFLIALEVMVQAAVMVWGIAGLGIWVDDGGVLDKQTFEDAFDGRRGTVRRVRRSDDPRHERDDDHPGASPCCS